MPVPPPSSNSSGGGQTCPGDTGGSRVDQERSDSGNYALLDQFCLTDIPGQEKGGTTPSYQLEGLEPIYLGGTLQDGRITPPSRPNPTRGLDDKDGPERCLSPDPDSQRSPVFPPVCLGGKTPVPPIWAVLSTKGFHKTSETSGRLSEADRLMPDNLSG